MQKGTHLLTGLVIGLSVVGLTILSSSAQRMVREGGVAGTARAGAGEAATAPASVYPLAARATGDADWVSMRAGAVDAGAPSINWMTVEDAADRLQKEKRPVLIDLYTTWCGWCKQMDKKTYSNKQVAEYLGAKFYTVKVDAESKATITWNGRSYHFNPDYRSNEFALYLTHGRLEFPTTVIIPPGGDPQAIPGYMEPKELELLVKYFGEGKYGQVSFDDYQKSFRTSW